jgi:hypothetical protein
MNEYYSGPTKGSADLTYLCMRPMMLHTDNPILFLTVSLSRTRREPQISAADAASNSAGMQPVLDVVPNPFVRQPARLQDVYAVRPRGHVHE